MKDLAHQKWNAFSKHWRGYNETNSQSNTNRVHLNQVFANCSEDDEIYPLTVSEIAEAQKADAKFKHCFKRNAVIDKGLEIKLVENTKCVCKEGRLVIHTQATPEACGDVVPPLSPTPWAHLSGRDD